MNLGTFIVASLLLILVILDIRYLFRRGISGCGGDCQSCHGSCKWADDLKKARTEIRKESGKGLSAR